MTSSMKNWPLVLDMLATAGLASGTVVVVGISGGKVIVSLPLVSFLGVFIGATGEANLARLRRKGAAPKPMTLETLPAVGVCAGAA